MNTHHLVHQIQPHELNNLLQQVSFLPKRTVLPSWDYVGTSYANVLDSIAVVLILWNTSTILARFLSVPFGTSTRSVAAKSLYDRFISFRITTIVACIPRAYQSPPKRWFTNLGLRLLALFFVALLIALEVAAVFSQGTKLSVGSLDDLHVHTIALRAYEGPTKFNTHPDGCISLITAPSGYHVHPLTLCNYKEVIADLRPGVQHNNSITFSVVKDKEWHTLISLGSTVCNMWNTIEIVRQDPDKRKKHSPLYANLTKIHFGMDSKAVEWFINNAKRLCNCEIVFKSISYDSITVMMQGLEKYAGSKLKLQNDLLALQMGMLQMTDRKWKAIDFIIGDNQKEQKQSEKLVNSMIRTKVKHISGTILWMVLIGLMLLNLLLAKICPDLECPVDVAMQRALAVPDDTRLADMENIPCQLVDDELADSMDLEYRDRLNLRLRPKENPYLQNRTKSFGTALNAVDTVSLKG